MTDGAPLGKPKFRGLAGFFRRTFLGAAVYVFVSHSLSVAFAQNLVEYRGTALSGINAVELTTSVHQCLALCENRPGCAGFDHDAATSTCRIFASVTSAREAANYTAATRQTVAGYADPRPQFLEYPDAALSGSETAKVEDIDRGRCRQLCRERSGCAGFDHETTANTCRMFEKVSSARDSRGSFAATRDEVAGFRPPSNLRSTPPPLPQPSQSRWLHNGSVMTLHQKPKTDGTSEIEIAYEAPKDLLLRVGVRSGSTLFRGTLSDGILTGKARLSSSRCGLIEYDVQGPFDPRSSVPLFLRGPAPKRGEDCSVESWNATGDNANLRFDPQ